MAGGGFELDAEALARAEAAVAALSDDYLAWVRADLARLAGAVAALRDAGAPCRPAAAEAVFAIAHDIKGQAGTFGYPLLTRLGAELCRQVRAAAMADLAPIEALAAAMAQVVAHGLTGDGGAAGAALLARLEVEAAPQSGQD
jgi:HPt (histidine-containing phosphotransfer) domain-containing protein